MNATESRQSFARQPLLSLRTRIVAGLAVAALIVLVVFSAKQASHEAVQIATDSFSRSPAQVTLETVVIVGKRDPVTPAPKRS